MYASFPKDYGGGAFFFQISVFSIAIVEKLILFAFQAANIHLAWLPGWLSKPWQSILQLCTQARMAKASSQARPKVKKEVPLCKSFSGHLQLEDRSLSPCSSPQLKARKQPTNNNPNVPSKSDVKM